MRTLFVSLIYLLFCVHNVNAWNGAIQTSRGNIYGRNSISQDTNSVSVLRSNNLSSNDKCDPISYQGCSTYSHSFGGQIATPDCENYNECRTCSDTTILQCPRGTIIDVPYSDVCPWFAIERIGNHHWGIFRIIWLFIKT